MGEVDAIDALNTDIDFSTELIKGTNIIIPNISLSNNDKKYI